MKGVSLAVNYCGVKLNELVSNTELNYLEIGCFDGCNLKTLADSFPNKTIYGIDPFISDGNLGTDKPIGSRLFQQESNLYENIKDSKNINFYKTTSELFYKNPPKTFEDMNISCIFIDGAHILSFIKIDVELAVECILKNKNKKGEILFDDLHIPDVLKGIEYLEQYCWQKYTLDKSLSLVKYKPGYFGLKSLQ